MEDLWHIPQGWRVTAMLSWAKGFICLKGCTSGLCLAEREAKQQWHLWWPHHGGGVGRATLFDSPALHCMQEIRWGLSGLPLKRDRDGMRSH